MTKIYLIIPKVKFEGKKDWIDLGSEATVFTNKKLAEAYAEYWNNQSKKWKKNLGQWKYYIRTCNICTIDYREDNLKEQMENLPY